MRCFLLILIITFCINCNNYKIDNKIASVSLNDLKNKIKDGAFSPETIIFNTAINTKGELLNNFEVDIKSSWLSKFF